MKQLSKRSGVPVSTIKYYFRENLLPSGIKANRTTVFYGQDHIDQLRAIKQLQDDGLSLRRIKSIVKNQGLTVDREYPAPSARRENIILTAFPLFVENGLEMTSITDIVKAARISRNTFYREFKSKRDAFVACLDKILADMINAFNDEIQNKTRDSNGGVNEIWNILGPHSAWTDFMNLLGSTIVNDPQLLSKMLDDHIDLRAIQIKKVFDRHIQKGIIRIVDTELLALIILGSIDTCNRFIRNNKFRDADRVWEKVADMLMNGISVKADETRGPC